MKKKMFQARILMGALAIGRAATVTATAFLLWLAIAQPAKGAVISGKDGILMGNMGYIEQYPSFPVGDYGLAYSNFPGYVVNLGQLIGVDTNGQPIANFKNLLPFVGQSLQVVGTNGDTVVDIGASGLRVWDAAANSFVSLAVSNGTFQAGSNTALTGSELAAVSNGLFTAQSAISNLQSVRLDVEGDGVLALLETFSEIGKIQTTEVSERRNRFVLFPKLGKSIAADVLDAVRAKGWKLFDLKVDEGRLDDVFRRITLTDDILEAKS